MRRLSEGTADDYIDYLVLQRDDAAWEDDSGTTIQQLHSSRRREEQKDKYKQFCDILKKNDYDPVEFQIKVAKNENIEWSVRERANKSLLERYIPALKSIEHSISGDTFDAMIDLKKQMQELSLINSKDH